MDSKFLVSEVVCKIGVIICKYFEIYVKILLFELVIENSYEFCYFGRYFFVYYNYMYSLIV